MYDVVPYFLAKIVGEIPAFLSVPMQLNGVTYFFIGFTDDMG